MIDRVRMIQSMKPVETASSLGMPKSCVRAKTLPAPRAAAARNRQRRTGDREAHEHNGVGGGEGVHGGGERFQDNHIAEGDGGPKRETEDGDEAEVGEAVDDVEAGAEAENLLGEGGACRL